MTLLLLAGDHTGKLLFQQAALRRYSWASPAAQLLKNPPAMWETWVQSLGWEDPLVQGKATHSSILAWRIPWGRKESATTKRLSLSLVPRTHIQNLRTWCQGGRDTTAIWKEAKRTQLEKLEGSTMCQPQ